MRIHLVGAGGVSFWLGVGLAQSAIAFTCYDDDDLQGGLGHMRLPKASPSTKKVALLRGFCIATMGVQPGVVTIVDTKFNGDEVEAGDLVVDGSDMPLTARKVVWERAKERGARCLRVSYDGKNGTVAVAEGLPLFGKAGGGYSEVPNLALSLMAGGMGALAVQGLLSGSYEHIEFQVSMSEQLSAATVVAMPVVEKPKRQRRPRKPVEQVAAEV